MKPIYTFQKGKVFVLTRTSEKTEFDAEEYLRHLNTARKQLEDMEKGIVEFKRDIKSLERFESVAKKLRSEELEVAKKQRDELK